MCLLLEPRPRDLSLLKTHEDKVIKELVPLFHSHGFDGLSHLLLLASFFFGFGGTNGRSLILRRSLLWHILLGWASTTHVASFPAVKAAAFFLQTVPFLNAQCIQLCSVNLHAVFFSDPAPLGFIPVTFLIAAMSQDILPSLPFSASWFGVCGATQACFDFCPKGMLLLCGICPPIESGGSDWCFLQDSLMKAWCQPLFEEHKGPSVVFTPSC